MKHFCILALLVATSGCIFGGGQTPVFSDPDSDNNAERDVALDASSSSDASGTTDAMVTPDATSDAAYDMAGDASPDLSGDTDVAPDMMMAVCGDGVLDAAEICDNGIADVSSGGCPEVAATDCPQEDACQPYTIVGDPSLCTSMCMAETLIEICGATDGCCPPSCNETNDADCDPFCGNDVQESGEICDGNCPNSCDDITGCKIGTQTGSAATCDFACTYSDITSCIDNDGCCPPTCDSTGDNDCVSPCGNGIVDVGEQCDGGVGSRTCLNASLSYSGGTLSCDNTCKFDMTGCTTVAPGALHYMFVTSSTYRGDLLHSTSKADMHCNSVADSSSAAGYSYVSFLLDSNLGFDMSEKLVWGTAVRNVVGTALRTSTAWPWSTLLAAIRVDEDGVDLDPTNLGTVKAWTGAKTSGDASGEDCKDAAGRPWRGTNGLEGNSGAAGRIIRTDNTWMDGLGIDVCNTQHHLYCISARTQPNIFVFATSTKMTGGQFGGSAGADRICREAGSSGMKTGPLNRDWFAMLGDDGISPRYKSTWDSAIHGTRSVYNTNGDLVEANSGSWPWALESPVAYDQNGAALDATRIWTGAISGGGPQINNCSGWTSNDSAVNGFTARPDATASWLGDTSISCDTPLRLFCVSR